MQRGFAYLFSFGLCCCHGDAQLTFEIQKTIRLEKNENAKSPQQLVIKKITDKDKSGAYHYSTRLEIVRSDTVLEAFQEFETVFEDAKKFNIGKEEAYFVTCERTNSSWGARKSIIIWNSMGIWHILPLHFKRASLHKEKQKFLIAERMSNRNEEKSARELYQFKDGLLGKYSE